MKQMERERRESEVMLREEACQWKTKLEDQQVSGSTSSVWCVY